MLVQFKRLIVSILTLIILSWLVPIFVFSQEEDAEWTVYQATPEIFDIAIDGNYLWVASKNGLFKINAKM